jgi:hypothetical protein
VILGVPDEMSCQSDHHFAQLFSILRLECLYDASGLHYRAREAEDSGGNFGGGTLSLDTLD